MPSDTATHRTPRLAIVGGGPAGLMAAETARAAGLEVDLYEAMGSVGRKFLIAGKGGLNLTHSEARPAFDARFGARRADIGAWLDAMDGDGVRNWARNLGVDTYVGSSGRVFPLDRKAAPLLRGWVRRLRDDGVRFHVHHRWLGWDDAGALRFDAPGGGHRVHADVVVLALGGGSWPQLGSDGAWQPILQARGVDVAPLRPANCGFDVAWSEFFRTRHAGAPIRHVVAHWRDAAGQARERQGECVASEAGIEGSLVYAVGADLREAIARDGDVVLHLDLAPERDRAALHAALARPANGRSLGERLRRLAGLDAVKVALVHEALDKAQLADPARVAATIKRLPLRLLRPRPIAEAISSAGGVRLEALDEALMCRALHGVFCAGEMLDWEAPTGGYLLTASLASGRVAAQGAVRRALATGTCQTA
jgi:uncharacterized flavoprotein (TIGR03862 family)